VVRNRPDSAGQGSDEEAARRWWNLFPGRTTDDDKAAEPEPDELAMLMAAGQAGSDSSGIVADPAAAAAVARALGRDGAELRPLISSGRGAGGPFGSGSSAARSPLVAGGEPQPRRVCVRVRDRQPTTAERELAGGPSQSPKGIWRPASLAVRGLLRPKPNLHRSLLAASFRLALWVQAGLDSEGFPLTIMTS
jgi:hypothetical protein